MIYTFDIEDYYKNFCKYQLNENINFNNYFFHQTIEISEYLKSKNISGIFYILGEVAENYPELVKKIFKDNHTIGLHGYNHKKINNFTKNEFKNDLKKSIYIFNNIDKKIKINHYRSPSFSMLKNVNEYYEVLNDLKIFNSSSFTNTNFSRIKNKINLLKVKEKPLPSINLLFIDYKFTGGSYFRLTPLFMLKYLIKRYKKNNIIFYFHPYDFFYVEKLNPFKYINTNKPISLKNKFRNFFYNINTKNNKRKYNKILEIY